MSWDLHRLHRYSALDGKTFLVCVGAMKCATSWVHHYLGTLPGVAVSPLKELHFFNRRFNAYALGDMDALSVKRLEFHLKQDGDVSDNLLNRPAFQASVDRVQMIYDDNAYFGHFARLATDETRTLCDITPAYSVLGPEGFEYLREFCASQEMSLKLLFILRDPVERLWSQLRQMQQLGGGKKILEEWPDAFRSPRICARADYEGTVQDLDRTFPSGDLLYLFFEDLFAEASLRRLAAHAGVDYRPAETGEARNETGVKAAMPEDARAAALKLLARQYAFCRERFGPEVPASWQG